MSSLPILFLGTGLMGAPMATHLAQAGFDVSAWNRTQEKSAPLAAHGVEVLGDYHALPIETRIVVFMLSTGPVCDQVLFGGEGDDGLVARLAPNSLVIVMSSIPVEMAQEQAARLSNLGIGYVDAPVSGGERGAIDATLSIMAGGLPEDVECARLVLEKMGRLTHVGPAGSGQLVKLANQIIVGITIGAVSEAFILAEAGGADLAATREALLGGFADSTILRQHGQRIVDQNFEPGAHTHVQLKDTQTAKFLAQRFGLKLPHLDKNHLMFEEMCNTHLRISDHSALYLHLKNQQSALE